MLLKLIVDSEAKRQALQRGGFAGATAANEAIEVIAEMKGTRIDKPTVNLHAEYPRYRRRHHRFSADACIGIDQRHSEAVECEFVHLEPSKGPLGSLDRKILKTVGVGILQGGEARASRQSRN